MIQKSNCNVEIISLIPSPRDIYEILTNYRVFFPFIYDISKSCMINDIRRSRPIEQVYANKCKKYNNDVIEKLMRKYHEHEIKYDIYLPQVANIFSTKEKLKNIIEIFKRKVDAIQQKKPA